MRNKTEQKEIKWKKLNTKERTKMKIKGNNWQKNTISSLIIDQLTNIFLPLSLSLFYITKQQQIKQFQTNNKANKTFDTLHNTIQFSILSEVVPITVYKINKEPKRRNHTGRLIKNTLVNYTEKWPSKWRRTILDNNKSKRSNLLQVCASYTNRQADRQTDRQAQHKTKTHHHQKLLNWSL